MGKNRKTMSKKYLVRDRLTATKVVNDTIPRLWVLISAGWLGIFSIHGQADALHVLLCELDLLSSTSFIFPATLLFQVFLPFYQSSLRTFCGNNLFIIISYLLPFLFLVSTIQVFLYCSKTYPPKSIVCCMWPCEYITPNSWNLTVKLGKMVGSLRL